jgi:hypothetical protein
VTIKRKGASADSDEMPAAKLYLDDIRDIVEILTAPEAGASSDAFVVKYRIRDLECDTLEDLEELGGRVRQFEIDVSKGDRTSSLKLTGRRSYLWLLCPEIDYWKKQAKIRRVFENNSIAWKNVINDAIGSPVSRSGFWSVGFWIVGFWIINSFLLYAAVFVTRRLAPPAYLPSENLLNWIVLGVVAAALFTYILRFSGSVAVLHYSHTKGWRRFFQEHGVQVLLVVLGVVLKTVSDLIWHHFSR